MTTIIQAVYEGGVLRPMNALALPEGETVDLVITPRKSAGLRLRAPTPAEDDYARRVRAAKSLKEVHDVMATAPIVPEDEFDIVQEINRSRQLTGFRLPDPGLSGDETN